MRYLKWFYSIIYRIPVDVIEVTSFIDSPTASPLVTSNIYNYIIIFLLSSISGASECPRVCERLLEVNRKVPIVTFYRAAFAFRGNSPCQKIFNINPIKERKAYLKEVFILDKTLNFSIDKDEGCNVYAHDKDQFVLVRPFRKDSEFSPLMLLGNDVIASQSGLNIFIGQKGIAIPREDLAFEFNRPAYFLRLLDNILKKSPVGYLRLKLNKWPVVLRMDDPPLTWEQVSRNLKILGPTDYFRILNLLREYKAKMTVFVTPAFISKSGKILSWNESDFENAKEILRILREGMKGGLFEIGCHGLTHLTIGYKPPSRIAQVIYKLLNVNIAREFYDSLHKRAIPYDLQKKQLETSIKLIEDLFGIKPTSFAPPAHTWDDSTEKACVELGMPFLSADMNFYIHPDGFKFRKNPSPLGESAPKHNLIYISATILGSYGTFNKTLKVFNELGIPLVWQQHNFYPSWFTVEILETFFKDLTKFENKVFMTISELGGLLQKWRKTKIDVILNNDFLQGEIYAEIPGLIEAYNKGITKVMKVMPGNHSIVVKFDKYKTL
jgi:peptidoglycan/xylan/chitin deacetylase (PgdA/CDA1 family)